MFTSGSFSLNQSSLDKIQPNPTDGKKPNLLFFANFSEPLYPKLNSVKYLLSKLYENLPDKPIFLEGKVENALFPPIVFKDSLKLKTSRPPTS